jgi:hypothetical protein
MDSLDSMAEPSEQNNKPPVSIEDRNFLDLKGCQLLKKEITE